MFENLRDAFREAIENFKAELNRQADDVTMPVPGTVDRLLLGMQNEIAEVKDTLRALHAQIEQTKRQILHESSEESTCRRREELARKVGDEETARLAAEYAARHARRRDVLERKATALEEEHAMRAAEVAEMNARLREAQEKRDTLAAADEGAETAQAANDLFEEIDRLAGDLDDEAPAGRPRPRIADDIGEEYGDLQVDPWAEIERPQVDYDERLADLKKRMGRE
jgi:phage shock protein A